MLEIHWSWWVLIFWVNQIWLWIFFHVICSWNSTPFVSLLLFLSFHFKYFFCFYQFCITYFQIIPSTVIYHHCIVSLSADFITLLFFLDISNFLHIKGPWISSRWFLKDGSSRTPCMKFRLVTHMQGSTVSNIKF